MEKVTQFNGQTDGKFYKNDNTLHHLKVEENMMQQPAPWISVRLLSVEIIHLQLQAQKEERLWRMKNADKLDNKIEI